MLGRQVLYAEESPPGYINTPTPRRGTQLPAVSAGCTQQPPSKGAACRKGNE